MHGSPFPWIHSARMHKRIYKCLVTFYVTFVFLILNSFELHFSAKKKEIFMTGVEYFSSTNSFSIPPSSILITFTDFKRRKKNWMFHVILTFTSIICIHTYTYLYSKCSFFNFNSWKKKFFFFRFCVDLKSFFLHHFHPSLTK